MDKDQHEKHQQQEDIELSNLHLFYFTDEQLRIMEEALDKEINDYIPISKLEVNQYHSMTELNKLGSRVRKFQQTGKLRLIMVNAMSEIREYKIQKGLIQ